MRFSIIIPVYNIENYIGKLLDTILEQSFLDYEVIIVNDGSTDNSEKIINQKICNNSKFKMIIQNNLGPGAARNTGIKAAKGEYLLFWDGDDFITQKDALKRLDIIISKSKFDILVYPIQHSTYLGNNIIDSKVAYENLMRGLNDYSQVMNRMLIHGFMLSSPCEMLISRQWLIENKLFFPEGVFSEDVEWIIRIMEHAPKLLFSDFQFYCYRWNRPGSTCNSIPETGKILDIISFINYHYNRLVRVDNEIASLTLHYLAYQWCVSASKVAEIDNYQERNKCLKRLCESKNILMYRKIKKVKVFSIVSRTVGLSNAALLWRFIYKMKRRFLLND